MTAGSLVDSTIVVAVDDTLYLYPVTQSDDDSVQEILTDELVKVSVWIVTSSGLAGIPGIKKLSIQPALNHFILLTCNINSTILHIPISIFTVYSVSIDTGLYSE